MKSNPTATPIPESEGSFISLQSTHLSAFLATCECNPTGLLKGPEVTAMGNQVTKWHFKVTPMLEEIVKRWRHPKTEARDWGQLSDEEKDVVINFITAFSDNLKHFLSDAKRESV
jgi:hypothetical protein